MLFNQKKKEITNFLWLFLDKIFRSISGLIIIGYIARKITVEGFGEYSYVVTSLIIIFSVIRFGMSGLILNQIIKYKRKRIKILNAGIQLQFLLSLIISILLIIYSLINYKESEILTFLIIIIAILTQPFYLIRIYYESENRFNICIIKEIIIYIVSNILKVYISWKYHDVNLIILIHISEYILINIAYLIQYKGMKNILNKNIKINAWILKKSIPLFLSSIIVILYMRVDQYIIKYYHGNEELGYYTAAQRITEIITSIAIIAVTACSSTLTYLAKEDKEKYIRRSYKYFSLFFYSSLFLAIIIFSFSESIIQNIFGAKFMRASDILEISIWSAIFTTMGILGNRLYIIQNLNNYVLLNSIFGFLINLLLNIILIPKYGVIGASLSCLLSTFFIVFIADSIWKETKNIFYMKLNSILKPI